MHCNLSILIATIPERKVMFDALCTELERQWVDGVEILYNAEAGTIGQKRQVLLQQSKGEYVAFIDDDDSVSDNYIRDIMKATDRGPDCVGISGIMTTNGGNTKQWHISKDYTSWHEANGVYYRSTNHLSPVRRSIALSVGFPNIAHGEDYAYSMGLKGLLTTEVKIPHSIYHYKFITKNASNRIPGNKRR